MALARWRAALVAITLALILAGCGSDQPSAPVTVHAFGEPLDPGVKPDAAACQARIRSEEAVAARIRTDFEKAGLKSDPATIKAVAADPTADLTTMGIPLTARELAGLQQSGIGVDSTFPIVMWVQVGAPERFGGLWFDGPTATVAIVDGDPVTLAVARCLEGAITVRYVWTAVSAAGGEALKERVVADIGVWKSRGVAINMVDFDETKGVVTVGLSVVNDELRRVFFETYGPLVQLVVEGPAQAL
jgi:hypothetical protein